MVKGQTVYHVGLQVSDLKGAKVAILPGDPGRVEVIAKRLDNPVFLKQNREFTSYLGTLKGVPVLVISTGMGGPSTAICVEELTKLGITYFIRVGTCGGMQLDVLPGDLIIAQGAIRQEGTSKEYVPIEYPALANFNVLCALKSACKELGYPHHVGVVQCKDSFYGQHEPERMPVGYELQNKWNAWIQAGCLASEMETASLFIVASALKVKAGAILAVVWNQEREKKGLSQDTDFNVDREIDVAIKAIEKMIP